MPSAVDAVRAEVARINALGSTLSQVSPSSAGAFASMLSSAQGDAGAGGVLSAGDLTGADAAANAGGPASGAITGAPTGDQVVSTAEKYLGVPYQWGGTDSSTGLDCSGLVQLVFGQLGVALPRTSQEQQQIGQPVASIADARPGDLVFYGSPAEHVGIYVGNGRMIDAPHSGTSVRIEGVGTPTSIRRVASGSDSSFMDPASFGSSGLTGAGSGGSVTGAAGGLGPVPQQYASLFLSSAARYGLSPTLLAAVAKVESGFNPDAVSPAGAVGLMQMMPSTAAGLGVDPTDPAQAVDGAARLLSQDLARFGSVPLAVAAYNAGAGAVAQYGGLPPYPETQQYVSRVMSLAGGSQ